MLKSEAIISNSIDKLMCYIRVQLLSHNKWLRTSRLRRNLLPSLICCTFSVRSTRIVRKRGKFVFQLVTKCNTRPTRYSTARLLWFKSFASLALHLLSVRYAQIFDFAVCRSPQFVTQFEILIVCTYIFVLMKNLRASIDWRFKCVNDLLMDFAEIRIIKEFL